MISQDMAIICGTVSIIPLFTKEYIRAHANRLCQSITLPSEIKDEPFEYELFLGFESIASLWSVYALVGINSMTGDTRYLDYRLPDGSGMDRPIKKVLRSVPLSSTKKPDVLFEIYCSHELDAFKPIKISITADDKNNLYIYESVYTIDSTQLLALMELIDKSGVDNVEDSNTAKCRLNKEINAIVMDGTTHIIDVIANGMPYSCHLDNIDIYKSAYNKIEYYRVWFKLINDVLNLIESWGYDTSRMM